TIIIVEHRLFYLKGIADRYLLIQNGSLINSYKAEEFEKISSKDLNALGLRSINLNDIVVDDHKVKEKEISSDNSFDFEVKNISKKYKNNFVLKDVSLKFDSNETIALVGINGTGKSTLGKIYSGIQNQTDGEIKINGLKANKKMRLSKVWYIPQDLDSQLFGEDLMDELLTGLKNREDYITKAEELLKKVGLFDIRDKHPATLSGGQKQRLVLCVAMLRETPFIILDEPTSGLDFRSMDKVGRLIKEEKKKGTKFLIISHDIEFIAKTCDRLVKLENGIITEDFYIDNIGQLLRAMEAK
ncbi:MAG: ATP-binding cassette domain-containing protein, partial [Peptoniphilus harei]|nr:ATP-binding cassette domain-containing protein [Peptoniphilus harei]